MPEQGPADRARAQDQIGAPCERTAADALLACVIEAFPSLSIGRIRVEHAGGDHVLLIIDDRTAFRFPRAGMHDLTLEIAVLRLLKSRCVLPTPSYDYIDPLGRFAGYAFIVGAELTPARFAALPPAANDRVLGEAVRFLAELHGLPIERIRSSDDWPATWTAAQFAERGLRDQLPVIASLVPRLARRVEAFFRRYGADRPDRLVIVHGDLVADHILLDARSDRLAGIIDFGDVGLGDPAQDFLAFWSYGADAAVRAVGLYPPAGADPGLFGRSRNHFVRYQIDRLSERIGADAGGDVSRLAAEVDALLSEDAPAG